MRIATAGLSDPFTVDQIAGARTTCAIPAEET